MTARVDCPSCGRDFAANADGSPRRHKCAGDTPQTAAAHPDTESGRESSAAEAGAGRGEAPAPATPSEVVVVERPRPRAIVDLYAVDAQRARSRQREIGMSALGGCRRRAFETIAGTPRTNETRNLQAVLGTAIHEALGRAARARNPFALVEHPVYLEEWDLRGNVDFADPPRVVEDWKTKDGVADTPDRQQRYQVHTYGYALAREGRPVERVRLVFIPRSGDERDVRVWEEPYSEETALEALLWLEGVRGMVDTGIKPDPERNASTYCAAYCPFYDPHGLGSGCAGRPDKAPDTVIDDPAVADAAARYLAGHALEQRGKQEKASAKEVLVGQAGLAGSAVVGWSSPRPREVLDEDAVRATYALAGLPLPVRLETASPRVSVKPAKGTAS